MAVSFDGSTGLHYTLASPITSYPFAISIYVLTPSDLGAYLPLLSMATNGSNDASAALESRQGSAGNPVRLDVRYYNPSINYRYAYGSSYTGGSWAHILGTCQDDEFSLYLNGSLVDTDTETGGVLPVLSALDSIGIGVLEAGSSYYVANGTVLAEASAFNYIPSSRQIAMLASGFSAAFFRPVFYSPLIANDGYIDAWGVHDLSTVGAGSLTAAAHPPIIRPTHMPMWVEAQAASSRTYSQIFI